MTAIHNMLVLSRKPGEAIFIGDDVVIRVLGTSGPRVSIGVDAPRDVEVRRAEKMSDAEHEFVTANAGRSHRFSVSDSA